MDLLCNAYSTASDDDDDDDRLELGRPVVPPPPKRPRPDHPHFRPDPSPQLRPNPGPYPPTEPSILPGRYIAKRERAVMGCSVSRVLDPTPPPDPVATSPVVGSILDSDLPHGILSSLRHQTKGQAGLDQMSDKLSVALSGHSKAVNVVQWSTNHGTSFVEIVDDMQTPIAQKMVAPNQNAQCIRK